MGLRILSFRQAAFWSTAINAFSQGLALIFSMVMAAVFGAQESTDVLYYCIGIFALLSGLLQAVNVSVLIPETMRRRHQAGEADAMAFINRFFAVFAGLILGLTAWVLWDPAAAMGTISRFSAEALQRNSRLVFWLLATLPLQMVAQLLLDVLVSYKFLTLPATLSCVNRVLNTVFVLLFHRQLGVVSVALGMLLGFALQVALNLYLLRHVIHWNPLLWRTRIGGTVYRNIGWTGLGTLASTAAGYLPLFLFSGFSAGALTALNYARRLSSTPTQLLTMQVSNVAGIKFNELAATGDLAELALAFGRLCRVLIQSLVPLAFGLMLVSHPATAILFGRGDFGPDAVRVVALLFGVLILALPLEAMNFMVARYFIARQAIPQAIPLQVLGALLNAGMVYICVRGWGVMGFPMGVLLYWGLYFLVLALVMPRLFTGVSLWPILGYWLKTVAAGGAAAAAAWGVARAAGVTGWNPWLSAPVMLSFFAIFSAVLAWLCPPDREALSYGLAVLRQLRARKGNTR
jgi:putative peptidoglycan lipid II flippase